MLVRVGYRIRVSPDAMWASLPFCWSIRWWRVKRLHGVIRDVTTCVERKEEHTAIVSCVPGIDMSTSFVLSLMDRSQSASMAQTALTTKHKCRDKKVFEGMTTGSFDKGV